MANFNTTQVRQFYVASAYAASVTDASAVGTIGNETIIDEGATKELYFLYKGADTVLKSDRIQLKNLDYAKFIPAADMVVPLKSVIVALDTNVNSGAVEPGQDYVLRINLRQFYGMGDEDQYFKDAAVHATSAMVSTPLKFYQALKSALDLAFSREIGATKTSNPYFTFTAASTGLTITEKEQDWTRGIGAFEQVNFDVFPTTVFIDGEDVIWGTVTDNTVAKEDATVGTDAVGNGKKIADMEWFYLGERGDQYRMMGYPNYIPTEYLVDPTQEYDVLELHYAFTDTGVNSYRTEKDITIVAPTGLSASAASDMADALVALEIPVLGVDSSSDGGSGNP